MFNEIGVPMSDVEMNMLPPGQNKPHQQMLAESGVEMNLTFLGGAMLATSIGGSLFGSSSKKHAAKMQAAQAHILRQQQAANQAAQTAYKHTFDDAMIDIENERTMEIFDIKLDNYEEQIEINKNAANSAFSAEQFKFNEQMEQAKLNRNRMYKQLLQVQGAQAAKGGTASRSRERAELINSLGQYGQDQAEFDKTLYSAKSAHNQRIGAISAQHENADYTAWTQIAIAPQLKLPGQGPGPALINTVGQMPVKTGIGFGDILGAASAGMSGLGMGAQLFGNKAMGFGSWS